MSPAYQGSVSLNEFRQRFEANPAERLALSAQLARTPQATAMQTRMYFRDHPGPIVLIHTKEGPRLSGAGLEFYDQSSPEATVRSLLQALTAQRYDILLRLMPQAQKAGLTPAALEAALKTAPQQQALHQLRLALTHSSQPAIEEVGDHATMTYGDHRCMQLVREQGTWKIATLE